MALWEELMKCASASRRCSANDDQGDRSSGQLSERMVSIWPNDIYLIIYSIQLKFF